MAELSSKGRVETRVASGDLDGSQFTMVRQLGNADVLTMPTTGAIPFGVLQDKPKDNEHAGCVVEGITKIRMADSLGANIFVMAGESGFAVQAASGQTTAGRLITGATSGALGVMNFETHPSVL